MSKIRQFDIIAKDFVKELCKATNIPEVKLHFNSGVNIAFPNEVTRPEVIIILLIRISHFIGVEIEPRKFKEIKEVTLKLLSVNFLQQAGKEISDVQKYFVELFSSGKWNARDLTAHNTNNSGKNHLVLLGEHKEKYWYSLKLNRYSKIEAYSLMIGYRDRIIQIYKFGPKH